MVIATSVLAATAGTAAPIVAPVVHITAQARRAEQIYQLGGAALRLTPVVVRVITGKGAATAAASSVAAANAAVVGAGAATGTATGAATTIAAANFWNPVGWAIGSILLGAEQSEPWSFTWACYKPIIGETYDEIALVEPITLAALTAHPKILHVSVGEHAASAGLPDVEVANTAGEYYLLRGVALPWGALAYHAERVEKEHFC